MAGISFARKGGQRIEETIGELKYGLLEPPIWPKPQFTASSELHFPQDVPSYKNKQKQVAPCCFLFLQPSLYSTESPCPRETPAQYYTTQQLRHPT